MLNRYVLDPCRVLPSTIEQPPPSFTTKHEKEYSGSKFDPQPPPVIPQFTGFPQFPNFAPIFDPMDWQRYPPPQGPRRTGPMRRGLADEREHPYSRGGRGRDSRPLKSYRDLDAPQEATPELNY